MFLKQPRYLVNLHSIDQSPRKLVTRIGRDQRYQSLPTTAGAPATRTSTAPASAAGRTAAG